MATRVKTKSPPARAKPGRKRVSRALWRPLIIAAALFYLGFHALHGERGVYAWFLENKRLDALGVELEATTAKRARLEHDVVHLRSDAIDTDLLDEQVRRMLGGVKANEVIVLLSDSAVAR